MATQLSFGGERGFGGALYSSRMARAAGVMATRQELSIFDEREATKLRQVALDAADLQLVRKIEVAGEAIVIPHDLSELDGPNSIGDGRLIDEDTPRSPSQDSEAAALSLSAA